MRLSLFLYIYIYNQQETRTSATYRCTRTLCIECLFEHLVAETALLQFMDANTLFLLSFSRMQEMLLLLNNIPPFHLAPGKAKSPIPHPYTYVLLRPWTLLMLYLVRCGESPLASIYLKLLLRLNPH